MRDNRRYPRVEVNRPGQLRVADGPGASAQLIDISEGGATLFYAAPVVTGAPVELEFHLVTDKDRLCHVVGEVRHFFFNGKAQVVGVHFTDVDPQSAEAIREFVRQTKPDVVSSTGSA